MLVYDVEIARAVPPKDPADRLRDIRYCDGWHDTKNMGVSVLCAYDYDADRYRVFTKESFQEFARLAAGRRVVGFNSLAFDDVVCAAAGVPVQTTYDLLVECWVAAHLPPVFQNSPTHGGFGLDALAYANLREQKSGHGARAPVDWQRGRIGTVIDYCVQCVRLTKLLLDKALIHGFVNDPRNPGALLNMRTPWEVSRDRCASSRRGGHAQNWGRRNVRWPQPKTC